MDYNEAIMGFVNRHPWELSRTKCVLKDMNKYLSSIYNATDEVRYINIGAGDCFFDSKIQERYDHILYAIDIAYPDSLLNQDDHSCESGIISNVNKAYYYRSLDEIPRSTLFDYGIMMDSLEYMDDDELYLLQLSKRIKPGGYIFITVPYNSELFSEHDVLVGNKRRYGDSDIRRIVNSIDGLDIVVSKRFYFLLYIYRRIQLLFKLRINPRITTGWSRRENSFVTRMICHILNADYSLCGRIGFQGLSMFIVLRKN